MQAALCLAPQVLPFTPAKVLSVPKPLATSLSSRFAPIKAASVASEATSVDYSSSFSVFPAEACETIGGDTCLAEMYPEVKPRQQATDNMAKIAADLVDREYLEYNDPKTVLPGDACDVLGGEFCERTYQKGVY
ncbi:light-regulated protein, chloroplastic [Diospyros lotus]|uniref:light-regulated protein, chloroplastic n=1 Tax=Diospyros lotus TaxID=55363 RepID=UPI002259B25B|nr:light-regulated protein, chloroplastic [Diospyros lotus]